MEPSKSQVQEIYLNLCLQLILDGPPCPRRRVNLRKDIETIKSRYRCEGLSFLTKTLPRLGKWFDQCLVETEVSPPPGFATKKGSSIPAFLQAYFTLVLEDDGSVRDNVDPTIVAHIRQICFVVYKLELSYTAEQENQVIGSFVSTEAALESLVIPDDDEVIHLMSRITKTVFSGFDPKDILPRHGPGSVATGERLEDKWVFTRKYKPIHSVYPYYDYFIVGGALEILDRLEWYKSLRPLDRGIAKVILVPKDSRGPRLISCEPLEYQWIQQGLGRKISHFLESDSKLTRGHVNFTNQEINRQLALSSSSDGKYATIDLKDASDRVSVKLVSQVFSQIPDLLTRLLACRTAATLLPSGRVLDLQKYAPMGSALCFPVEAYIFWCICTAAVVSQKRLPLKKVASEIYVYGDDIVIPTAWVDDCVTALERYGLVVNRSKCCTKGLFRESCGMDAFNGVQVTPTRVKTLWTDRSGDGNCYVSWSEAANHLAARGYVNAASYIRSELERVYGVLPRGTSFSSYPCVIVSTPEEAVEFNTRHFKRRWNVRYQRFEFKMLRVTSKKVASKLDSWTRLLREQVLPSGRDPSLVVIPRSTGIKRGWVGVY